MNYKVAVVIPTLNAASDWDEFSKALLANVEADQVLILDSESTDGTRERVVDSGVAIRTIPRNEFNHGGTRQLGVSLNPEADIVVFLTQDAVLEGPGAISRLVKAFDDTSVGAAYGRQLPRKGAGPIEAHARLFNYPANSNVREMRDKEIYGVKSIFISNSFAAYRRSALEQVGGFPANVIFGEDTITVAKLLNANWKIAYVADARVYHSHQYTLLQELKRYFDIGVLHSREAWLMEGFGKASGEGRRFVQSEIRYLWGVQKGLVPVSLLRTGLKLLGYRLGKLEKKFGNNLKRRLSMNRGFWR